MAQFRPEPFGSFQARLARYPAAFRCSVDAYSEQTACDWRQLALECRDRTNELCADPILDYQPRPGDHQPPRRSTAATSTRPGVVTLSSTDPLKQIPPREYVFALTGEPVPDSGRMRCPLPDHDDNTPSFRVYDDHVWCFGCQRGGSIYGFASALYGVAPIGPDFLELRRLLAERLRGVHA